MPFDRPSLSILQAQVANDINAALPGVDAMLRYAPEAILGQVLAALANGHYGYLDYIAKQIVPFTATDEYLEGWAALKGITRKPAIAATGSVQFSGADGAAIPAGTAINRSDGVSFFTTSAATIAGAVAMATVQATLVGAAGNTSDGSTLYLGAGLSGVTATCTASGPITGGADVELNYDLRSRMLAAYAKSPQGGSIDDYGEWALAVPGVTRAWVAPSGMGPGTVVLQFMMDEAQAASGGFPQGTNGCASYETRDMPATGDQLTLANAIYLLQPVTALVYAVAPTPNRLDLTIAGLSTIDDSTKAAIEGAIDAALVAYGQPGGVTNVSIIEAAIAAVSGTAGFVLTDIAPSAGTVAPGSAGNITSNAGALPVRGNLTYA